MRETITATTGLFSALIALLSFCSYILTAPTTRSPLHQHHPQESAGTLDSGKPIKKPETHCDCNVENHLTDFDF
jgi:hypothetical protein